MKVKSILLVEDNRDDEDLTVRALRQHNLINQIDIARDGQQALDHLLNLENPLPALVLLDLKLPKVSGLEVLEQLRANRRTATVPVVIFTSSKEEQDLVESYGLGCNSFIHKPVDFVQFSESIKQLQLYWLLLNEYPSGSGEFP